MNTDRTGHSTRFQLVVSSIIFFGTIGLVVWLVISKPSPKEQADNQKSQLVEFIQAKPYNENIKINVTGVTLPFREIKLAAEVMGVVVHKSKDCKAGRYVDFEPASDTVKPQTVRKLLLSIDPEKYNLAHQRAEAEVAEAKARLAKTVSELEAAGKILELAIKDLGDLQQEHDRNEVLYEKNAISLPEKNLSSRNLNAGKNAVENQSTRVATLENDKTALENQVKLKETLEKETKLDLKKAEIRAPASGVIISDEVEEGDFVQVGKQLLVFEDTEAVEIGIDLRADQLQEILQDSSTPTDDRDRFKLPPLPATIRYQANDKTYEWTGVLDRYDGLGLNEKTRTAPCRIAVKNTRSKFGERTLVRGMYVSVELKLAKQSGLVAIPADAVWNGNEVRICEPIEQTSTESESAESRGVLRIQEIEVLHRVKRDAGSELVIARSHPDKLPLGARLIVTPIPLPVQKLKLRYWSSANGAESKLDSDQGELR